MRTPKVKKKVTFSVHRNMLEYRENIIRFEIDVIEDIYTIVF